MDFFLIVLWQSRSCDVSYLTGAVIFWATLPASGYRAQTCWGSACWIVQNQRLSTVATRSSPLGAFKILTPGSLHLISLGHHLGTESLLFKALRWLPQADKRENPWLGTVPAPSHLGNWNDAYWWQMAWHEFVGGCFLFVASKLNASMSLRFNSETPCALFAFLSPNSFQLPRSPVFPTWSSPFAYKGSTSAGNGGQQQRRELYRNWIEQIKDLHLVRFIRNTNVGHGIFFSPKYSLILFTLCSRKHWYSCTNSQIVLLPHPLPLASALPCTVSSVDFFFLSFILILFLLLSYVLSPAASWDSFYCFWQKIRGGTLQTRELTQVFVSLSCSLYLSKSFSNQRCHVLRWFQKLPGKLATQVWGVIMVNDSKRPVTCQAPF